VPNLPVVVFEGQTYLIAARKKSVVANPAPFIPEN